MIAFINNAIFLLGTITFSLLAGLTAATVVVLAEKVIERIKRK